jgi:hypothetical protein
VTGWWSAGSACGSEGLRLRAVRDCTAGMVSQCRDGGLPRYCDRAGWWSVRMVSQSRMVGLQDGWIASGSSLVWHLFREAMRCTVLHCHSAMPRYCRVLPGVPAIARPKHGADVRDRMICAAACRLPLRRCALGMNRTLGTRLPS